MNTNEVVKTQTSEQQLPSVSSEISSDSHDEKALTTYKNKKHLKELGGETRSSNLKKALFNRSDTFFCYK